MGSGENREDIQALMDGKDTEYPLGDVLGYAIARWEEDCNNTPPDIALRFFESNKVLPSNK